MAESLPPSVLRLLVVDDEPPARSRLLRLLAAEPGVQVLGQAGSGAEALSLAQSLSPDALLLDVQMPEVSGLDVAASLPDRAALEGKLAQAAAQPDQPEVHVRPNKLVEYKAVATVLASAQRLGVTKLGMVGNEQFVK